MPTLTRQELYDLVWSTPMTKVAEGLGLSDRGLAKICDRHRVSSPPRGYWAKKEAGKKVKQAIFVAVDDPSLDKIQISAQIDNLPEPVRAIIEKRRSERRAATRKVQASIPPVPSNEPVLNPHSSVQATAAKLRRSKSSQARIFEAIGPGLCGVAVSEKAIERIIFILHRIANTCEARGIKFSPAETRIRCAIGEDDVTFEIKERTKQVPHVLTEKEVAEEERYQKRLERLSRGRNEWDAYSFFAPSPPKFDTVRTGELNVEVHVWGGDGLRRTWRDGNAQVLESLIDNIVDGIEAHIVAKRHHREEYQRAEAERNELERRRCLARARLKRESERRGLLNKVIRTEQRAGRLREWIERQHQNIVMTQDPDLNRMIKWARSELVKLEAILDPVRLTE
jgi:hypothetical protein